ncbi:hypothetical protein AQJ23_20545 [Streptomyces antibioticus]|nr:hypothetical protein AQJ23_20545 [Streptomyces antibioticus]
MVRSPVTHKCVSEVIDELNHMAAFPGVLALVVLQKVLLAEELTDCVIPTLHTLLAVVCHLLPPGSAPWRCTLRPYLIVIPPDTDNDPKIAESSS